MGILLKISICQSDMVHEGCCMNFPTRVRNLKNSQDGFNCHATLQG